MRTRFVENLFLINIVVPLDLSITGIGENMQPIPLIKQQEQEVPGLRIR